MTEKDLSEMEADFILGEVDKPDKVRLRSIPSSGKERVSDLYGTLVGIDKDLNSNQQNMSIDTLLKYRKSITDEIASLEGRDTNTDPRKFIPMNVTFNIQNNS